MVNSPASCSCSSDRWVTVLKNGRWANVYLPLHGGSGVELIDNHEKRCQWLSIDAAIYISCEILFIRRNGCHKRTKNVRILVESVRTTGSYAHYGMTPYYFGAMETSLFRQCWSLWWIAEGDFSGLVMRKILGALIADPGILPWKAIEQVKGSIGSSEKSKCTKPAAVRP